MRPEFEQALPAPRREASATVQLVRTALIAALAAALGYLGVAIPNLELISAAVFAGGAVLGARRGAVAGAVAEAIFAGFNPMGVSPPPLFVIQVACFAGLGAAGGLLGGVCRRGPVWSRVVAAASCGFILTLLYDVVTAVGTWVTVREQATLGAILFGSLTFPFPLAHVLGNTVAYAAIVPPVVRALWARWHR